MNNRKTWKQFIVTMSCLILLSGVIFGQDASKEKFKEFNFWEGSWDVFKTGTDSIVGKSKIKVILKNMAVRESYNAAKSEYKGTSLNKYNQHKGKWEQFWVDNTGLTLHLEGGREGNKMVMQSVPGSGTTMDKISWEKKTDGTVRQIWLRSKDDGKTWKTLFDGTYVKKEKKEKDDKGKKKK